MWVDADSTIDFGNVRFRRASAAGGSGGFIFLAHNTSGEMFNVDFEDGQATGAGGMICVADGSRLLMSNVSFVISQARGGGALAVLGGSSVRVYDSNFSGSVASGGLFPPEEEDPDEEYALAAGGGMALVTRSSDLTLVGCNILAPQTSHNGGAVRLGHSCSLHVSNSSFLDCAVPGSGGVVRVGPYSTVRGSNNLFANSRASKGGGVMAFASRGGSSWLADSRFSFDGSAGCLSCPTQKEFVFGICLDHNQSVRAGHDIYLLQPCKLPFQCAAVLCWGLEWVGWHDACAMESGGWRVSSRERCGADTWPWKRFEMPEIHWAKVAKEEALQALRQGGEQQPDKGGVET